MKINNFTLYLLLSSVSLLSLGGCIKDDSSLGIDDLPGGVQYYLSEFFPNQTPLKVEKVTDEETGELFLATFPDNVSASFNQEGYWQQFNMPDGNAPAVVQERYNTLFDYVNLHQKGKSLIRIKRTAYGESGTLNDGKTYAFYGLGCLGEEIASDKYTALPNNIRTLIEKLYPDIAYQHVVINAEEDPEVDFYYKIWLSNEATFAFSVDNELKSIYRNGEPLPSAVFDILPEKVLKELEKRNIKTIYQINRKECDYQIWDTPHNSYVICIKDLPPLNLSPEAIQVFIDTYFGTGITKSVSVPFDEHEISKYDVMLPNGFNFVLNGKTLGWTDVDGYGLPFGEMQKKLLPEKLLQYITSNFNAEVTKISLLPDGYQVVLTNGKAFECDTDWNYRQERTFTRTPYNKAYAYIRFTYPNDLDAKFASWQTGIGWEFRLKDNTIIKFDTEGNLVS